MAPLPSTFSSPSQRREGGWRHRERDVRGEPPSPEETRWEETRPTLPPRSPSNGVGLSSTRGPLAWGSLTSRTKDSTSVRHVMVLAASQSGLSSFTTTLLDAGTNCESPPASKSQRRESTQRDKESPRAPPTVMALMRPPVMPGSSSVGDRSAAKRLSAGHASPRLAASAWSRSHCFEGRAASGDRPQPAATCSAAHSSWKRWAWGQGGV